MTQSRNRNSYVPFFQLEAIEEHINPIFNTTENEKDTQEKKRRRTKDWEKIKEFVDEKEAESIRKSKDWMYSYSGTTQEGKYIVFRCSKSRQKLSKIREEERQIKRATKRQRLLTEIENYSSVQVTENEFEYCSKLCKLVYLSDSSKVVLYETHGTHENHDSYEGTSSSLSDEMIRSIETLYVSGVTKPSSIISSLRYQHPSFILPSRRQVYYQVQVLKKKIYGDVVISLGELLKWCESNSAVPEDLDEGFVVKHEGFCNFEFKPIDDDDDDDDNDENGMVFRFFITTKRLLNMAIKLNHITTDATYKLIWLGFPVLVVGTTDKNNVYHPYGIGVSTNETAEAFKFMFNSIKEGVQNIFDEIIRPNILQADNAPSITNLDIKNSYTFRERLPMNEFLPLLLKLVKNWSIDRNIEKSFDKPFYKEVPLTERRWADAFKFAITPVTMIEIENFYYFNYDYETKITKAICNSFKKVVENLKSPNFDAYANNIRNVCRVTLDKNNWKLSVCLCSNFQKQSICDHVLGLAIRLKLVVPPTEAINLAMKKKKLRGRKKTAKCGRALIKE